jgi:hypothetical protein
MRQCGGEALGVFEGLEGWHLHIVGAFGIEGAGSTAADIGAGRGEKALGGFDALKGGEGRGLGLGIVNSLSRSPG